MGAEFDPRLTAARADLAAEHLRGVVEASRYAAPRWMVVATTTAPLANRPDPDASMTTELLHGERFAAYELTPGWLWGQAERDGYVGWAPDSCFMRAGEPATERVRVLHALVYPKPDLKTRPVAALPFDARLRAGESDGRGWRPVEIGGWLPAAHLASVDEPEPDWVAAAERFLGVPYLWGGRSAAGIDCSGLIQTARQAAGLSCPRDSDMQEEAPGEDVAPGRERRGDLIFWRGHVGVMLSDTEFLHANAFHMACAREPLAEAEARIAAGDGGPVTARRRWTG